MCRMSRQGSLDWGADNVLSIQPSLLKIWLVPTSTDTYVIVRNAFTVEWIMRLMNENKHF